MDVIKRSTLSQRVQQVKPSGIRKFFDIINTMPNVISLGVGEPDFVTPEHIRQAGIASIQAGRTQYTSNYGTLALREEIARMLQRRTGLTYDPARQLLVTVGVSEGVDLVMRTLIDPGDEVISSDPGYVAYEADIIFSGGVAVPVTTYAEYNFAVRAADIEAAITPRTKLILLGTPNNPTGAVIPREELEGIARIAIKYDLIVAVDEVYSRLVYDIEHFSIASFPGMQERTILLDGFSKAYAMTGWRVGYVAAPSYLLEAMCKIHQYTIMCAGTAAQEAALEALRHGEDDVLHMQADYARRGKMLVAGLNRIGLPTCKPHGAFYAFPYVSGVGGMSDEEFAERLLVEEEVAVVPGSSFGDAGKGYVRVAYCTAYEKLEEALVRIDRFVKKYS
ncbi:aminotransferase class I/II-fold pyridoxal phosphate-dependent enzyme [Tengunoibacter tsumagoiensis]|uniref:Aminotransferase n=1 Tax=Tengunoibacter tsumagoiensis TaxID=2014871 RepID=A0A401ZYV7_9CHLR|nr:aminotransferase class I/II-fold pyridoxal phosphate-dependent enzyme [Tengunoibacter tsumagoiensis]GCE12036.1 putative aminotransferase YugH [Tengunoibacter tsumagoiensis]